jgi:hypothetical protein
MIINHRYKFIFLKTRKTAGTSIESALSQFCDSNDIITPIINDRIAVDFVGRYESLGTHLKMLQDRLGLPNEIIFPRAKSGYRQNPAPYSQILNSEGRARVEIVCAKEMAALG